MQFYSISDRGKQRFNNEDCCVAKNIGKFTVLILADGMGGHSGGEIASSKAIEAVLAALQEKLTRPLIPAQIFSTLSYALKNANDIIYELSLSDPTLEGMGTTIDVCIISDHNAYIAHIGDSRVYHITMGGEIKLLTKDHSLMQYMIEKGELTAEQAQHHPQKNVIIRALGTSHVVQEDTATLKLSRGDRLLLCSDGLTNMLSEKDISNVVLQNPDPEAAARELIRRANDAGGDDNITVIIALA